VRNLLAVAAFRQTCRRLGVAEVALTGTSIRVSPVELPDSGQLRLKRLYPSATYRPTTQLVSVPRPVIGDRVGAGRIAGTAGREPLRDTRLLDWCMRLITDLVAPAAVTATDDAEPSPVGVQAGGPRS
jgi:transcription-repair coupling factor (superfamily II helicase)